MHKTSHTISRQFDYSDLPAALASEAREVAQQIRKRNRDAITAMVASGLSLLQMQGKLKHGQFLAWIETECGFSKSAAYRLMDIAKNLADKLPAVGSLPLSTIYQLAAPSTPESVRREIVKRLEEHEPQSPAHIASMIRAAKWANSKGAARHADDERTREHKESDCDSVHHCGIGQRRQPRSELSQSKHHGATSQAVELIRVAFGDQIGRLSDLLKNADLCEFKDRIIEIGDSLTNPNKPLPEENNIIQHAAEQIMSSTTLHSPACSKNVPQAVFDVGDIPAFLDRRSSRHAPLPDGMAQS